MLRAHYDYLFQSHGASSDMKSTLLVVFGVLLAIAAVIVTVLVFVLVWRRRNSDRFVETDKKKKGQGEKKTPLLFLDISTSQSSSATDATLANIPSIVTDEVSGKVRDSKGLSRCPVIKR